MHAHNKNRSLMHAGRIAIAIALSACVATPAVLYATPGEQVENNELNLSVGRGRLINLPAPVSDVFVANQEVADVQVRSATQIYVFGKAPGETSVYATSGAGRVVYSAVARVGNNIETIDQMLALAMPEAHITATTMNGFVLLTGTVAAPEDAAEADRLVTAFVGEGTRVISRLQTATPLQVNLQVRIAEVNRSLVRQMGGNLVSRDPTSGFQFGAFRGRGVGTITPQTLPTRTLPDGSQQFYNPYTGAPVTNPADAPLNYTINPLANATTLAGIGRLFGVDVLGALDLGERTGMVSTLAQPNLTAVSGETADFLAGGEYPIPVPDPQSGTITIQYRRYGVSLAYTPTVLSNGRISLRVRPEVSELTTEGAITINGFNIPALSVRRTETTVELGSGESFMIAGLMSNRSAGSIEGTPGLSDLPILGTLFKSDDFRRGDTELVIVITPYLVRPVSADQIVLPTDGFRSPTDLQRLMTNGIADGESGARRPMPTLENAPAGPPSDAPAPGPSTMAAPPAGAIAADRPRRNSAHNEQVEAAPGFGPNN